MIEIMTYLGPYLKCETRYVKFKERVLGCPICELSDLGSFALYCQKCGTSLSYYETEKDILEVTPFNIQEEISHKLYRPEIDRENKVESVWIPNIRGDFWSIFDPEFNFFRENIDVKFILDSMTEFELVFQQELELFRKRFVTVEMLFGLINYYL